MNEFRKGDIVLVAGTVVAGDDDTIRVSINGIESVVSADEATLVRKSFHPGDEITSGHENAVIVQTIESGVHLVNFPARTGAAAYQVVDESGLAHREEEKAPAKTEAKADVSKPEPEAPAPAAEPAKADGEQAAGAEPTPRFVFEKPGAAPKFTDRAEGAEGQGEDDVLELGGHEAGSGAEAAGGLSSAADDLASSLGGDSAAVDIDLEEIGVTKDFRPLGERGAEEA